MARLVEIFSIVNGIFASNLDILDICIGEYIMPLLRPSSSFLELLAGYIDARTIPQSKIFPANSLIVSTDGEGSHTYSYVIPYRFVPNSNVSVLIPRQKMPLKIKIFYSLAITQCRWRYSYGRKPKGNRLENLELPPVPAWIEFVAMPDFKRQIQRRIPIEDINKWGMTGMFKKISDLFDVKYGSSYELNHLTPDPNGIAFVSRTSRNNGISGRVSYTGEEPAPAPCLTVALGGSVLETFFQNEPTYQGRDIAVLIPQKPMNKNEFMWYAAAIRQHQFRFNYGRQANRQLPALRIPEFPGAKLSTRAQKEQ